MPRPSSPRRRKPSGAASPSEELRDRARGAMLGTFVGDALGMPFEGRSAASLPERIEMADARLGRGSYTDDTELAIALAESLLRCDVIDEEDLAATFRAGVDRRRGYGAGFLQLLDMWDRGVPVPLAARQLFGGQGSRGNGAAMRVAPLAVRFFDDGVLLATQARRSAGVSHSHPEGVDGAVVQALAVATAIDGQDVLSAARAAARTSALRSALGDMSPPGDDDGVPPTAVASVAAAVRVAPAAGSFEEAVTAAVRMGGDTDTVAAMAGAIAGARFGMGSIPSRWTAVLEDGERGRQYVIALADRLIQRAVHPATGTGARG